jgi:hypothetical protein
VGRVTVPESGAEAEGVAKPTWITTGEEQEVSRVRPIRILASNLFTKCYLLL